MRDAIFGARTIIFLRIFEDHAALGALDDEVLEATQKFALVDRFVNVAAVVANPLGSTIEMICPSAQLCDNVVA